MWLIAGALVILGILVLALWLDHRGGSRRSGPYGPDEVRNRVEGNALLGKDWRSSGGSRS